MEKKVRSSIIFFSLTFQSFWFLWEKCNNGCPDLTMMLAQNFKISLLLTLRADLFPMQLHQQANSTHSLKKNCLRETKHLSTDADRSTDTKKNHASKAKFAKKQTFLCGDLKPFSIKSFQIWDQSEPPLFFPKDSGNLTILEIRLWELGAERRWNGVNKWKNPINYFFCRGNFTPFMSKSF